jgi:uncharacterized protein YbjT (DUF2867 family)
MTITTYLITGATGDIGSRVVERLLKRGERPRIFVRHLEKARARYGDRVDFAVGDLGDRGSLLAALEGVDALFLVNSGPELASRDEAAAMVAKSAGVKNLVKLSSMDARQNVGTGAWHARGECAIRASGITFTFVQPAGFMSNALEWASSISAKGVVRAPTGDGRIGFIHPDDIAAVATEALATREYLGESLPISGPGGSELCRDDGENRRRNWEVAQVPADLGPTGTSTHDRERLSAGNRRRAPLDLPRDLRGPSCHRHRKRGPRPQTKAALV